MNEESYAWTVNRVSLITILLLIALNVVTVAVGIIFASNAPSEDSENVLTAIMRTVNAFAFWAACVMLALGAVLSMKMRLRPYVRIALPWMLVLLLVASLGWIILGLID